MREKEGRKEGFYREENIFQRREVIKSCPWVKGGERGGSKDRENTDRVLVHRTKRKLE